MKRQIFGSNIQSTRHLIIYKLNWKYLKIKVIPNLTIGQYEESNCYAMGWGTKRFSSLEENQLLLRDVKLPIVRNDKCEKILQTAVNKQGYLDLGPDFKLHKSFNCAGYVYF